MLSGFDDILFYFFFVNLDEWLCRCFFGYSMYLVSVEIGICEVNYCV